MLVVRLARRGKKKQPFYDIVVAEKSRPVTKKFLAKVGYYNPLTDSGKGEVVFDAEIIKKHITNGAQLSQAVARLLAKNGLKEAGAFIEARVTKPKKVVPAPESSDDANPSEESPAEDKTSA